jgi:DNA polymerase I-like protein with 3'-5' exonuclease and polymerase domains
MCVYLNFAGAHTFRWSGGDKMNWQNFTRGSELRKCIVAPKGYVLVVADLSQIEARMLNCLAEQWDVARAFEKGDPYSVLASKFFERPSTRRTTRRQAPCRQGGRARPGLRHGRPQAEEHAPRRRAGRGAGDRRH